MKLYLVGGAVRDDLLGQPPGDRDWVAVGATPQQLIDAGYTPVGRDFPVFLHPRTREEVALARTERKTAPGYRGFVVHAAPDVTLEQDLARRDLTINAMARDADSGELIDPYGGRRDLADGVLRHVSTSFAEDPVRILRLARFAARWPAFRVAGETLALMRAMVAAGEVDALVAERVWQELARGLMEQRPSRMLEVLHDCGALARLLPALRPDAPLLRVLDTAALAGAPLPVRYACLCRDLGAAVRGLSEALRASTDCRELADVMAREHPQIHRAADLDAAATLALLERCDALRRPQRFAALLAACEHDAHGRALTPADAPYPPRLRLEEALARVQSVDTATIAAEAARHGLRGPAVGAAIHDARVDAIR